MKNQSGKTPLGWLLAIVIFLIIVGVSLAMILGKDDVKNIRNKIIEFQNRNNTVQTENK